MSAEDSVTITLTKDEAPVLEDLLSDFGDQAALQIVHRAQRRALWNACCLLEKALVEPFMPDYKERLEAAKKNLTDAM